MSKSNTIVEVAGEESGPSSPGLDSLEPPPYLSGWRLPLVTFCLCFALFLAQIETTIVSTSLLSITNELQDFTKASWVVTSYLLSYTGFLIPIAKISDIYGRFPVLIGCLTIFMAFSAAAGWARNMVELCVFRAFQGIGGGGLFDLTFVILPDLVPVEKFSLFSVIVSSAFAFSATLGPILGGLIDINTTWRWVFWLNLPAGAVLFVLTCLSLPPRFPYQNRTTPYHEGIRSLTRIDWFGAFLVLAASVLFVAGLETGGTEFHWNHPVPIATLAVSVVCWIAFVAWERHLSKSNTTQEAVLPWRLITNRFAMGTVLNSFFVGASLIPTIIGLPLRFQIVDGFSPLGAGLRLIALTIACPIGNIMAGGMVEKLKIPPFYVMQLGAVLQTLALAVHTGIVAGSVDLKVGQYPLEVIAGIGFGLNLATVVMIGPLIVEPRDFAVSMGSIGQFRMLGGSIGISGCANILNSLVVKQLAPLIPPDMLANLEKSTAAIEQLGPVAKEVFAKAFAESFKQTMTFTTVLSACTIFANMLLYERRPRRMS